jgi:hypothetical protein
MRSIPRWAITGSLGAIILVLSVANTRLDAGSSNKHKPILITRLYTGSDGQTHSEVFEAKFDVDGTNEVYKMLGLSGGTVHRAAPGTVLDWHPAPRRQYVITLSGEAELEVAGGKKIHVGPGQIDLVEDTTGRGHITKVIGSEDRITLQLPLSDQSGRASTIGR